MGLSCFQHNFSGPGLVKVVYLSIILTNHLNPINHLNLQNVYTIDVVEIEDRQFDFRLNQATFVNCWEAWAE